MFKPHYKSNWIYWLLLIQITFSAVLATKQSDCDADDLECLEDYTTTSTSSYITSSSSSFGEPLSTVTAAASSDVLSDFHEAKLVDSKPHNPNIVIRPDIPHPLPDPTVEDNINQDHDLGSSKEDIPEDENQQLSALSNVEAGVLSACGVLVVAGVAVGIFVWKNTTRRRNLRRNHDMPMVDIETNTEDDGNNGQISQKRGALGGRDIYDGSLSKLQTFDGLKSSVALPIPAFDRDDFFSNWQRRNQDGGENFEFEPKQKLPAVEIISENEASNTTAVLDLSLQTSPTVEDKEITSSDDVLIVQQQTITGKKEQLIGLGQNNDTDQEVTQAENYIPPIENPDLDYGQEFTGTPLMEPNTTVTRPSALDPAYDPTALTYPLQKFLHTPTFTTSSPMQISVYVGSDNDDDDDKQERVKENILKRQSILRIDSEPLSQLTEVNVDKKEQQGTPLSQHLNKLLRYPSAERHRMESNSSSSKMVEISLHDDMTNVLPPPQRLASPKLNHILGKFTKEPLPVFDENAEMASSNFEKAYQGREQEEQDRSSSGKGPAQLFIDDYKRKYLQEHGKPFMSPLDLPDDQYVPLRDAAGPPLISRAEILADPVRRLGEDEIALWEQSCRKKELKRLSYEMWDEQLMRDEIEESDRKDIARFYGNNNNNLIQQNNAIATTTTVQTLPNSKFQQEYDDDQVLP